MGQIAGRNSGFNARAFRDGIRFVYDMAAPTVDGEQATFYFPNTLVYAGTVDQEDVAFDPHSTVITQPNARGPVKVSCGVEYADSAGNVTDFGLVTPATAKITVLDEEYAKIKGCAYVALRGERFNYRNTIFPQGLFDVSLYTLVFVAVDAT